MPGVDIFRDVMATWFGSLQNYAGGMPARGSVAGALVVLEHLRGNPDLNIDAHTAAGGSQIKGASGAAVALILRRFGETRRFLSEGGRTNRGLRGGIEDLLSGLAAAGFGDLSKHAQSAAIDAMQAYLLERVVEYHNQKRIEVEFDQSKSTWHVVADIFTKARAVGKEGSVAQYLVGAKLAVRLPDKEIENLSASTADVQLGRGGDFSVGDAVIHVTVAPMSPVFEKCRENVAQGRRPWLIVPDSQLVGARQNAASLMPEKIQIESLESFISQNVEELGGFSANDTRASLRAVLEKYNDRVDEVENDKSLLLVLPENL